MRNIFVIFVAIACFALPEVSSAQRARFDIDQPFRFLGNFQTHGYHWRNPGPCVGYYNPYSAQNSTLRTGGIPQGAESYLSRFHIVTTSEHTSSLPFDRPAAIGGGVAPAFSPNRTNANMISAEILSSEDVGVTPQDMSDLEKEIQSILHDNNRNFQPKAGERTGGESSENESGSFETPSTSRRQQFFEIGSRRALIPTTARNR